jgi:hypothetical protein
VEEVTTIIKVHTKLFLNEDDVNLYALKAIPKPQEKDMPSIMTSNEEVDIEKGNIFNFIKRLNMQEKEITSKVYFIGSITVFLQVIEMLIYIISFRCSHNKTCQKKCLMKNKNIKIEELFIFYHLKP